MRFSLVSTLALFALPFHSFASEIIDLGSVFSSPGSAEDIGARNRSIVSCEGDTLTMAFNGRNRTGRPRLIYLASYDGQNLTSQVTSKAVEDIIEDESGATFLTLKTQDLRHGIAKKRFEGDALQEEFLPYARYFGMFYEFKAKQRGDNLYLYGPGNAYPVRHIIARVEQDRVVNLGTAPGPRLDQLDNAYRFDGASTSGGISAYQKYRSAGENIFVHLFDFVRERYSNLFEVPVRGDESHSWRAIGAFHGGGIFAKLNRRDWNAKEIKIFKRGAFLTTISANADTLSRTYKYDEEREILSFLTIEQGDEDEVRLHRVRYVGNRGIHDSFVVYRTERRFSRSPQDQSRYEEYNNTTIGRSAESSYDFQWIGEDKVRVVVSENRNFRNRSGTNFYVETALKQIDLDLLTNEREEGFVAFQSDMTGVRLCKSSQTSRTYLQWNQQDWRGGTDTLSFYAKELD